MRNKPIRTFFIDALTSDSAYILRTLRSHASIPLIYHNVHYIDCVGYSRIYLETILTESALKHYLCTTNHAKVIRVFCGTTHSNPIQKFFMGMLKFLTGK